MRPLSLPIWLCFTVACAAEAPRESVEPNPPRWTATIGGDGIQLPLAVAVGPRGDTAVVGVYVDELVLEESVVSEAGSLDGFVVVFDSEGQVRFSRLLRGSGDEAITSVAFADDTILIGGHASGGAELAGAPLTGTAQVFAWVARLSPAGDVEWQRTFGGDGFQGLGGIVPRGEHLLLAGDFGSVIELDETRAALGASDVFVTELDAAGHVVWAQQIGTEASESVRALLGGSDGSIFVGGTSAGEAADEALEDHEQEGESEAHEHDVTAFVAALTAQGEPRWLQDDLLAGLHTHGALHTLESLDVLALSDSNEIIVGATRGEMFAMKQDDFEGPNIGSGALIGLDSNGERLWQSSMVGHDSVLSLALSVSAVPLRDVYGSFAGSIRIGETDLESFDRRSLFRARLRDGQLAEATPTSPSVMGLDGSSELVAIASAVAPDGSTTVLASVTRADGDRDVLLANFAPMTH